MELLPHSVHEFKSRALQSVVKLWKRVTSGRDDVNPFWAGIGNTYMDAQAYHQGGMDLDQIYIIDKKSQIRCLD
jgi:phosphatidate phosphatase PAH1